MTDKVGSYTLDGEVVDLVELLEVNDLDPGELEAVEELEPGEETALGGGAFAVFALRRVA